MTEPNYTTIEINGVKMQVDLRHARRIEEMRVGDRVRVLTKTYSGHEVNNGVIIGFEPFPSLPTIVIAYMQIDYKGADLKFLHWNANTKDVEVVKPVDDDCDIKREDVLGYFDRERAKLDRQIEDLAARRTYFLDKFRTYWAPVEPKAEPIG
jgi:hypothetical protein